MAIKITQWKSVDGQFFDSLEKAEHHENCIKLRKHFLSFGEKEDENNMDITRRSYRLATHAFVDELCSESPHMVAKLLEAFDTMK